MLELWGGGARLLFKKYLFIPFVIINTPFKILYSGTRIFFLHFCIPFLIFSQFYLFQDQQSFIYRYECVLQLLRRQSITYTRIHRIVLPFRNSATTNNDDGREYYSRMFYSAKSALVARLSYSIIYILLPLTRSRSRTSVSTRKTARSGTACPKGLKSTAVNPSAVYQTIADDYNNHYCQVCTR